MPHDNLWAPWRMSYIRELEKQPAVAAKGAPATDGCFLCDAAAEPKPGRDKLVLLNDERGIVLLNKFPYSNGHLLIAPREHVASLSDVGPAQRSALMELTELSERLLRQAMNPHGMNIGINLGRCAGAGLPGHLHIHILPRWNGDTNFIQTIGQVRVIPQAIEETYELLAGTLRSM